MTWKTSRATLSRRKLLAGASAGLVAPFLGVRTQADTLPSLAEIAAMRGITFGSCVPPYADAEYLELLRHQSSIVTAEWGMKPADIAPDPTTRTWETADWVDAFANSRGLALHGHTLFWHERALDWTYSEDWEAVQARYGGYIRAVAARYPNCVSWDVLNEVIGETSPFRDLNFLNRYGLDFIAFCFREAHAAMPGADLILNDFNLSCLADWCGEKRGYALDALSALRAEKVPVHGLGVQGHLSALHPSSGASVVELLGLAAELGVAGYISELDVNDHILPESILERDAAVAEIYHEYLREVLRAPSLRRVMVWGLADPHSWITLGYAMDKRPPETGLARPSLFDQDLQPKPAFWAVKAALESNPI